VSDTPLWLDAFEHDWDAAHERTVRGSLSEVVYSPGARRDGGSDRAWLRIFPRERPPRTGVFASEPAAGRRRLDVPGSRLLVPMPERGLALVLGAEVLVAYDAGGLAWESGPLTAGGQWLGRLDDELHLRAGDLLHRVDLRHGRTVDEPAPW